MKKLQFAIALGMLALGARSQPYGHTTYTHSANSFLTTGGITSNVPGFLLVGNLATTTSGALNFTIDKVDVDGNFNNIGTTDFYNEYQVFADASSNCSGTASQQLNGYPVSVIETTPGMLTGCSYALASAVSTGCYFSLLDNQGVPLAGKTFYYTYPAGSTNYYNTNIIEEAGASAGSGYYYICGSFQQATFHSVMYMLKVDLNGTIVWSRFYDTNGNFTKIRPSAIIQSPYASGGPEVAVVGVTNDGSAVNDEGFFMLIDGNNGNVNSFQAYGTNTGTNDVFSAIKVGSSTSSLGGPGFLISGKTDQYVSTSNPGNHWMLFIDPTGSLIGWNSVITLQSDPTANYLFDVCERYSSANGKYEYYGTVFSTTSLGAIVFKLDDAGQAFPGNNEIVYNQGFTSVMPRRITFLDNGASNDIGLHIYSAASTGHYLVQACFNGLAGCPELESLYTIQNVNPGPNKITKPTYNVYGGLQPCQNFYLKHSSVPNRPIQCQSASIPAGGSNARGISTGISKSENSDMPFEVYPNPAGSTLNIRYTPEANGKVSIELYNCLGQQVHAVQPADITGGSSQTSSFDFKSLNLQEGAYLVKMKINGTIYRQKIIYNPE